MKAFLSLFIALIIGIFSATPVLAHSGRTDEDGGHFNHATGEYHYHHGNSAHEHYGDFCPYDLVPFLFIGAAGIGLLVWFIRKSIQEKKATRSSSSESDPPTPPSPHMKPIRLVSPDPEPTEPLDPKTQMVTFPIVCKPRRDPDSVLTVEDIMPPPLKKTPPVTPKLEYSKPKKAASTSSVTYDPNHYTFAIREVKSSSIHSIGYSNGTLTVRFHSGREYVYFDVSISEYFSFINAPSIGKYYNEHIRQKYHGDFVGIKDIETPKNTNPT